jgi:hypothetical protein|tara:strand:- start:1144 stop:1305 length:162 start_codon:yes stop_codon:yes gene_type:complete
MNWSRLPVLEKTGNEWVVAMAVGMVPILAGVMGGRNLVLAIGFGLALKAGNCL